ncbi:MAG: serine hydrolase domain-containing protein [Gemmatimonadaceae bacterium]
MRKSRFARQMARLMLTSAGGAVLPFATSVAQSPPARPEVDRLFSQWNRADSPGCALGILQNGAFLYQRGYGSANLDYGLPNGPDMVYYVGSDSKQFAAASIGLLALGGRIGLDDDVRKYFPEMRDYGRPITVRHLVHHTSGIRDVYTLMSLGGLRLEDVFTDAQAVALIARQKELNFVPGEDFLYSNSGYFLMAQLIRRVTGRSLREFADSAIFQPLGMTRTHFHDDPGHIMKQRAMSYEPDGKGGFRISYIQNFDKIGAGGLYTALDDLRKWDENYYTKKVGGDALHRLIHTRGVLNKGDTLTYAFGNNVTTYRGLRITEHGGALMGYRAEILRFPDQRFTVLVQCNLGNINPGAIAYQIADQFLGDKMKAAEPRTSMGGDQPVPQPPGAPVNDATLVGSYYSEEVDATYTIRLDGGKLVVDRPLGRSDPLTSATGGGFRAAGLGFRFERGAGQQVTAFTIEAGRVRNIRFVRR